MRGLTKFEIAVELITWRERRNRGQLCLDPKDSSWRGEFADYLLYRDRRRHLHDVQEVVGAFVNQYRSLWDWYRAVCVEGGITICFLERQPFIGLGSFAAWRRATARIDHDVLLIHALVDQGLVGGDPVAALSRWGVFPIGRDHDLERILRRGMADTHVHFEAADPIPLLWARLVHGHVGIDAIPRYSSREIERITSNNERRAWRCEEKRIVEEAVACRRRLEDQFGRFSPLPPAALADEYLANERRFLLAGWQAARAGGILESDLGRCWDAYLVAKSLFHSEQQQFPGTGAGLSRFRQYLDRGASLTEAKTEKICKRAQKIRMRRLVHFAAESPDVRRIELRIAPKKSLRDYLTFFALWDRIWDEDRLRLRGSEADPRRIGFIVHFIRRPDAPSSETPLFSALRHQLDRQTAILHLFRVKHWKFARHIVGIDVANTERGCPPEIFAPYLKRLRGRAEPHDDVIPLEYWNRLKDCGEDRHPLDRPVLGLTYHVGEDYFHIVDGLRHMDCAARFLLECGDRIGHGLALGDDVERAAASRGAPAHLMKGVLLDNLAWLHWRAMSDGTLSHGEAAKVETAVHKLSEDIYGAPVAIQSLIALQERRYGLPPARLDSGRSEVDRLYGRHVYERNVRQRRLQWASGEHARLLDDLHAVVLRLQDIVVHDLRRKGIIIEANPTSNIATGAVETMDHHPLLRFLKAGCGAGLFSVNTDDPGVFATRVENEYALVFEALLKVMDRPEALALINGLRQTGLDSSFLRPEAEAVD